MKEEESICNECIREKTGILNEGSHIDEQGMRRPIVDNQSERQAVYQAQKCSECKYDKVKIL